MVLSVCGLMGLHLMGAADAYIPEPQPMRGDIEVTALYYPGTEHMPEWDMVKQVTPEVKPLLGWYDEHDPENIDWQIKWATEHGISSFCVCWYWNKGVQRLDHWVKAFYKARFRRHLKWYVMYANHNQPGSHSTADQIAVTKFWIENYFKTPEYYTIDGKPVVVYCTPSLLDNDFIAEAKAKGETLQPGEGIRRALDISEKMAKEAGLPGIYWVDMKWLRRPGEWSFDPNVYAITKRARFDAMMSYNLGGSTPCGMAPEFRTAEDRPRWCRYDLQVECAKKLAEKADFLPGIPFWPMIPTGYDDVSRAFQRAWTIHSVTPEKFRAVCEAVKAACVRKGVKRVVVSPINEWQEGSIAEPNEKFGFALYDALRDVFCTKPVTGWPKNLTPQELGRPLREYPPMFYSKVQRWEFDSSTEGWYRQPFGCPVVLQADGAINFVTTRDDLFNIRQRMEPFNARTYKTFRVRMRITPNATIKLGGRKPEAIAMRLKWGTVDEPIIGNLHAVDFEKMVATAKVVPDGDWHEYAIALDKVRGWWGSVNELWFEAVNVRAANVEIDWMRFE